jgi:hypothetical protein
LKKAQVLIEVIIAFAVATVAIVALVQVAIKSAANSGVASRRSVATSFARQGSEWVRQQREKIAWSDFYSKGTGGVTYCINDLTTDLLVRTAGGCVGTIGTTDFVRTVILTAGTEAGVEKMTVSVDVAWSESGRVAESIQEAVYYRY